MSNIQTASRMAKQASAWPLIVAIVAGIVVSASQPQTVSGGGNSRKISANGSQPPPTRSRRVELLRQNYTQLLESSKQQQQQQHHHHHNQQQPVRQAAAANHGHHDSQHQHLNQPVEDPSLTRREPRWMDSCNRRASMQTNDESLVGLIERTSISSSGSDTNNNQNDNHGDNHGVAIHTSGKPLLQKRLESKIRAAAGGATGSSAAAASAATSRRARRSILQEASEDNSLLTAPTDRDGRGGVVYFGKQLKRAAPLAAASKRTSFRFFSGLPAASSVGSSKNHQFSGGPAAKSRRIHHYSPPPEPAYVMLPPSSSSASNNGNQDDINDYDHHLHRPPVKLLVSKAEQLAVDELSESLRIIDMKALWQINCIRNTVNHIKSMPIALSRLLDRELNSSNNNINQNLNGTTIINNHHHDNFNHYYNNNNQEWESTRMMSKRRDSIGEQLHAWLPTVESLVAAGNRWQHNQQQQRRSQQNSSQALTNVGQQMQYFSLLLEQMVFEQVALDRRSRLGHLYRDFERVLLKLLCDTENLIWLLGELADARDRLLGLAGGGNEALRESTTIRELLQSISPRLGAHSRRPPFESPFERLIGTQREHLLLRRPSSAPASKQQLTYIRRDAMPLEQRHQPNSFDRLLRGQLVFKETSALLGYFDSILEEISG